jgi:hypothetical protein
VENSDGTLKEEVLLPDDNTAPFLKHEIGGIFGNRN